MDDWDLIRDFASTRSQAAFETLAKRYVDFVYSAALRQVGDRHLAEDVTQAVFLVLSQKATTLAPQKPGVLAGWLFNVTRFTSANAIKIEKRRRKHESNFANLMKTPPDGEPDWETLAPYLDAALSKLSSPDREALLLRFFSAKSHREVAKVLGISEDTARKRVLRAVNRLRDVLGKNGVVVGGVTLAALLTSHTAQAAPAGLTAACGAAICGNLATESAKGTILMMAAAKAKLAVLATLAILVMAGAGGWMFVKIVEHRKSPLPAKPVAIAMQTPQPIAAAPAIAPRKISGIVRMAGEPLPKAEVLLATLAKPVNVYSPDQSGAGKTITADDGSFELDVPDEHFQLVVRHPLGYAHVTREQLEKSTEIAVEPWAKIEGIAKTGSKPAAGETIILFRGNDNPQDPYTMLLNLGQTTVADAQGHYAFDRVVPEYTNVYRRLPPPWRFITAEQNVEALAGKTLNVPIGGRGRPVIGRIALPAGLKEKIDWTFGQQNPTAHHTSAFNAFIGPAGIPFQFNGVVALKLDEPSPDDNKLTWEELRIKREAWRSSPAGRKLFYGMGITESNFAINPDGSFRIDDVSEGKHQLLISIYHSQIGPGQRLAEINQPLEIGDLSAQGGQSDEPLDLGTIQLKRTPGLRVGQPAPALALKNLDGADVKLADFSGKFVLVVFWTPTKKPTQADLSAIKVANEKNSNSGKLVILTVDYENDPQAARRLIQESGMADIGIHCVEKTPTDAPDYLQTASLITLIDADGKVSATNLTGKEIGGAIYRGMFAQ